MDEEDELALLDYRTPKGRLIKFLEQKMKKPEIDDSLGKVLDQFSQLTNEQSAYLDNGIFHMNFAEDALLLQSCGQYYGKRVDKLWDELLQFHTRMVKYDETTAKHCTDSNKREARKQELAKLEERLNRGKRKKIVLTERETETPPVNGCYLFDIDQEDNVELFNNLTFPLPEEEEGEIDEPAAVPFEPDTELLDEWREVRRLDLQQRKRCCYSVLVAQYHKLRYRFKHYSTPSSDDIVYDLSDPEEFNTREGKLASFHYIKHLFDYNDMCLLPDEDFTVAKLRIAFILQKKWFLKNKIDPNAPYETYKEEWEKYQRDFFTNEKRKIQNMPQSNSEQLMQFYKALAKKEQIAIQKVEKLRAMGVENLPVICFENVIVAPVKEGYDGIFDPYIPEDFETPFPIIDVSGESPSNNPSDGDHEAELSTLLGDFPKLPDPSSESPDKLRSDSGYFDGGFEADDESDHEERSESVLPGTDTPFEFDKDNTENKDETATERLEDTPNSDITTTEGEVQPPATTGTTEPADTENCEASNEPSLPSAAPEESASSSNEPSLPSAALEESSSSSNDPADQTTQTSVEQSEVDQTLSDIDREEMNNAIKEFAKQASTEEQLIYNILENSHFVQTDNMISIVYNKPDDEDLESIHGDQIMVFGYCTRAEELAAKRQVLKRLGKDVEAQKADKTVENKKRKLEIPLNVDPPPKRRKLSQKQVQKLKKSLIKPVKELKWDHFFSLNYQVESGEGEVNQVEYESDVEDEDLFNDVDPIVTEHDDPDISGYHSDHVSHVNDEENCSPTSTPLPLSQDSGINMDTSLNESEAADQEQPESTESLQQDTVSEPANSQNSTTDFASFDLLTDLSNSTGIPRDELAEERAETRKLSPLEQEREESRARVAEWKEHITAKLKKLDEHEFDIHEYGANIMNNMTINEPKPFSEFVGGKSSAEVVRYFISSLQLANTLNVEICGAKKGELSNDTFELKLLNKERYHEHFREYQAPSEENLRDRLEKVKEIRMQNKALKKQCTKRKASEDQDYQPQSILKSYKSKSLRTPSKKIKILNLVNIVSPTNEQSVERMNTSRDRRGFDFQQPSTSWQADAQDQNPELESVVSDVAQTPTRSSIDSGFMPSCDEDFLEQFDQLQHISDSQLRSTPIKPRKILKVSLVRNDSY